MAIIRHSGMQAEVDQIGQGPDLVLFHSLLTDHSVYDKLLPALARDHRITLLSLPGFGASSQVEPGIRHYAQWIAQVFSALNLPATTDLLGNGFGAFLAAGFAMRHGRQCNRLTLIGAGVRFPDAGREAFRQMAGLVGEQGMAAVVETAMRRLFTEPYIEAHPWEVNACRSVLLRTDPQAFVTACKTLCALDFTGSIGELRNPTTVLVGEQDTATPPAMGQDFAAAVPGCRYIEIPDCAHAPQIQRPDKLLALLGTCLD